MKKQLLLRRCLSLLVMDVSFSNIRRAELSVGLLKELILAAGLVSFLC